MRNRNARARIRQKKARGSANVWTAEVGVEDARRERAGDVSTNQAHLKARRSHGNACMHSEWTRLMKWLSGRRLVFCGYSTRERLRGCA